MSFPFSFEFTCYLPKRGDGAPSAESVVAWIDRKLRAHGLDTDREAETSLSFERSPFAWGFPSKALEWIDGGTLEANDRSGKIAIHVQARMSLVMLLFYAAVGGAAALLVPVSTWFHRSVLGLAVSLAIVGVPYIVVHAVFSDFMAATCGEIARSFASAGQPGDSGGETTAT